MGESTAKEVSFELFFIHGCSYAVSWINRQ